MPQMGGSFNAKPVWRVWGPNNGASAYLVTPCPFNWADGSSDTLADHLSAFLLPENAAPLDRTLSDYVVLAYQRPGARPLYAVRLAAYGAGTTDSLLSAVLGAVTWAPVRWVQRTLTDDWEQF